MSILDNLTADPATINARSLFTIPLRNGETREDVLAHFRKFGRTEDDPWELVLHDFITVQGVVSIDVEWVQSHYAQANTVLLRFAGNRPECWGESLSLPVPFKECTVAQLRDAILTHFRHADSFLPCSDGCGTMTLNRKHYPSINNCRDSRCSTCWFKGFNEECRIDAEKRAKKDAAYVAKMKAQGYTHKVSMVVHPASGDDRLLEVFSKGELPDTEIKAMLRKRRSRILTDYKQVAL